jgi:hypothetical protein
MDTDENGKTANQSFAIKDNLNLAGKYLALV